MIQLVMLGMYTSVHDAEDGWIGEERQSTYVVHCMYIAQDINSLDVSPNDKLIVSGSQDKTAKVKPNPPVSNVYKLPRILLLV